MAGSYIRYCLRRRLAKTRKPPRTPRNTPPPMVRVMSAPVKARPPFLTVVVVGATVVLVVVELPGAVRGTNTVAFTTLVGQVPALQSAPPLWTSVYRATFGITWPSVSTWSTLTVNDTVTGVPGVTAVAPWASVPAATSATVQLTTPPVSVPPSAAETNVVPAGTWSVTATLAASTRPSSA